MRLDRRAFLGGLLSCPTCAATAFAGEAHWTYEGHSGPDAWGKLATSFRTCSVGGEQSPIDLSGSIKSDLPPLQIDWRSQSFQIINNGHTIQANTNANGA
jgi:carbonic anhydrase